MNKLWVFDQGIIYPKFQYLYHMKFFNKYLACFS